MPRYLVETDLESLASSLASAAMTTRRIADYGATWMHSYVAVEGGSAFCLLEGPDPESVRRAARKADWVVVRVVRVSLFDPYSGTR